MIKAEHIDHMGTDLTVVNAARVSFAKESQWAESYFNPNKGTRVDILQDQDSRLIHYLATHNHFTPFTHCMITLRETIPLFVARQRFKHTVGFSYNEVSRRYVDDTPEFHIPDVWRCRPEGSVKQGSGTKPVEYITVDGMQDTPTTHYLDFIGYARDLYENMIGDGIAPEQARMVLPQSMLTSYYVTGSLSAFARAYTLRADSHAQQEIQLLAQHWDAIIRPLFPVSWSALVD